MLSRADVDYARDAAQLWVDREQDWRYDDDEREHFALWFQLQCDDAGTLDVNIPAAFRVWEADVLPYLKRWF